MSSLTCSRQLQKMMTKEKGVFLVVDQNRPIGPKGKKNLLTATRYPNPKGEVKKKPKSERKKDSYFHNNEPGHLKKNFKKYLAILAKEDNFCHRPCHFNDFQASWSSMTIENFSTRRTS